MTTETTDERYAYNETLEKLSAHTITELPETHEWPTALTPENARQVTSMLDFCEKLTSLVEEAAEQRTGIPRTVRTEYSANELINIVESGHPISLQEISPKLLPRNGSAGSEIRQHFIIGAAKAYGPQAVFERLPPIILAKDINGHLEVKDGHTRAMLANKLGIKNIRAYVINE